MSCEKCSTTSCILPGDVTLEGKRLYADLRMDMENNELDIQVGMSGLPFSDWTTAVHINYCPFCGEKLPELEA